ncbi:hypothetical protein FVE85_9828 [Porphyridium purpureum]|uniref:RWP-RK domain-containing protein n=1 Tax=Porphyridium purpureum TaxID=35688 RepID=A0A5J4YHK3_PORPP|nr:hypothetical protein FVE85_9828 [Porphyridium purpureum]|eukprot:POR6626..scf289_17
MNASLPARHAARSHCMVLLSVRIPISCGRVEKLRVRTEARAARRRARMHRQEGRSTTAAHGLEAFRNVRAGGAEDTAGAAAAPHAADTSAMLAHEPTQSSFLAAQREKMMLRGADDPMWRSQGAINQLGLVDWLTDTLGGPDPHGDAMLSAHSVLSIFHTEYNLYATDSHHADPDAAEAGSNNLADPMRLVVPGSRNSTVDMCVDALSDRFLASASLSASMGGCAMMSTGSRDFPQAMGDNSAGMSSSGMPNGFAAHGLAAASEAAQGATTGQHSAQDSSVVHHAGTTATAAASMTVSLFIDPSVTIDSAVRVIIWTTSGVEIAEAHGTQCNLFQVRLRDLNLHAASAQNGSTIQVFIAGGAQSVDWAHVSMFLAVSSAAFGDLLSTSALSPQPQQAGDVFLVASMHESELRQAYAERYMLPPNTHAQPTLPTEASATSLGVRHVFGDHGTHDDVHDESGQRGSEGDLAINEHDVARPALAPNNRLSERPTAAQPSPSIQTDYSMRPARGNYVVNDVSPAKRRLSTPVTDSRNRAKHEPRKQQSDQSHEDAQPQFLNTSPRAGFSARSSGAKRGMLSQRGVILTPETTSPSSSATGQDMYRNEEGMQAFDGHERLVSKAKAALAKANSLVVQHPSAQNQSKHILHGQQQQEQQQEQQQQPPSLSLSLRDQLHLESTSAHGSFRSRKRQQWRVVEDKDDAEDYDDALDLDLELDVDIHGSIWPPSSDRIHIADMDADQLPSGGLSSGGWLRSTRTESEYHSGSIARLFRCGIPLADFDNEDEFSSGDASSSDHEPVARVLTGSQKGPFRGLGATRNLSGTPSKCPNQHQTQIQQLLLQGESDSLGRFSEQSNDELAGQSPFVPQLPSTPLSISHELSPWLLAHAPETTYGGGPDIHAHAECLSDALIAQIGRTTLSNVQQRLAAMGGKKRKYLESIGRLDLLGLVMYSRAQLASELDISITLTKKLFRTCGFKSWPYRKLNTLRERLCNAERALTVDPASSSLALDQIHAISQAYRTTVRDSMIQE